MINVTVGEQKTQSEKPFPKLMICKEDGIIILVRCKVTRDEYEVCYINGDKAGLTSKKFLLYSKDGRKFTDFNKPITLQNA